MSGRHPSDGIAPQLYVTLGKVTGLGELHFLTRLGDRRPRPPCGVASKAEADKVGSVCVGGMGPPAARRGTGHLTAEGCPELEPTRNSCPSVTATPHLPATPHSTAPPTPCRPRSSVQELPPSDNKQGGDRARELTLPRSTTPSCFLLSFRDYATY